jgi:hypothetical protein
LHFTVGYLGGRKRGRRAREPARIEPGGQDLKSIDQFMWAYQEAFRESIQHLARSVFGLIGFEGGAVVFLVGVAAPEHKGRHAVCVEPEDGRWKQEMFARLPEQVEEAIRSHPMQRMHYGDRPTTRDKPENIRRLAFVAPFSRRGRSPPRTLFRRTSAPGAPAHSLCRTK